PLPAELVAAWAAGVPEAIGEQQQSVARPELRGDRCVFFRRPEAQDWADRGQVNRIKLTTAVDSERGVMTGGRPAHSAVTAKEQIDAGHEQVRRDQLVEHPASQGQSLAWLSVQLGMSVQDGT